MTLSFAQDPFDGQDLSYICLNGSKFAEATLTVGKSGESHFDYLVIKMSPVLVSSVMSGGSEEFGMATEKVTLNFAKVTYIYTPQKSDGSADASIEYTWNMETNREE